MNKHWYTIISCIYLQKYIHSNVMPHLQHRPKHATSYSYICLITISLLNSQNLTDQALTLVCEWGCAVDLKGKKKKEVGLTRVKGAKGNIERRNEMEQEVQGRRWPEASVIPPEPHSLPLTHPSSPLLSCSLSFPLCIFLPMIPYTWFPLTLH